MNMKIEINAESATPQGKGASRRLRRAAKVPGILYGGQQERAAHRSSTTTTCFFKLKQRGVPRVHPQHGVGERAGRRCCCATSRCTRQATSPARRLPARAADEKIHMKVPLHFVNEGCAGREGRGRRGPAPRNDLDITCLPKDLPEFIEVDLADCRWATRPRVRPQAPGGRRVPGSRKAATRRWSPSHHARAEEDEARGRGSRGAAAAAAGCGGATAAAEGGGGGGEGSGEAKAKDDEEVTAASGDRRLRAPAVRGRPVSFPDRHHGRHGSSASSSASAIPGASTSAPATTPASGGWTRSRARAARSCAKESKLPGRGRAGADRRARLLAAQAADLHEPQRAGVGALLRFHQHRAGEMLVVHDELDLPPGTVRLKLGGGPAATTACATSIDALGTRDFWRLRIGIGHPGDKDAVADYVLHEARREDERGDRAQRSPRRCDACRCSPRRRREGHARAAQRERRRT